MTPARGGGADGDSIVIGFVCVRNAGRSQMSAAFAERERERRRLTDAVQIITGGTHPAERVHEEVVAAMDEVGIDLSDRTPRRISTTELESCDYLVTMGCSTLELDADASGIDVRDWALEDPHGKDIGQVREIREGIHDRVNALFDEVQQHEVVAGSE